MAGRGRDSKSVEAPRAAAGEVRGRGEPSPSGGRPANRELARGPPSPLSQRNPRVGRPPQAETKSRGAGGKVVGWRRGRAAGAGFVRLGLRGQRPAAFPRLRRARQSRGLRRHRRFLRGSGSGSRGLGSSWGERGAPSDHSSGRGARRGSPSIRGARVRAQRRLSVRRGRRRAPRWRLRAAGAPEGEGRSPAWALRRPPSEKRACCSVCYCCCRRLRRRRQPFPGLGRKLRFSGCKSADLVS